MIRPEPSGASAVPEGSRFWDAQFVGARKVFAVGNVVRPEASPPPENFPFPHASDDRLCAKLVSERQIESSIEPEMLQHSCLLCSEATAHHCHRRLVREYLNAEWGGSLSVRHL